jgi:hypothetical protein
MRAGFTYWVDSPSATETIASPSVEIRGWIVSDLNRTLSAPRLVSQSGLRVHGLAVVDRPDVEAVFPSRPCLGFQRCLCVSDVPPYETWYVSFRHADVEDCFPSQWPLPPRPTPPSRPAND